ncbi:MAG: putative NADH-quinone oxidoreductase chain [Chloroflexi bacterium]|nr:putative NADH-quinone oxidoreductase chain [Chloroflexota bacterium]
MNINALIWFLPLPPILAFFLIVLVANRKNWISHTLAILAVLLTWAAGMVVFIQAIQTEHLALHPFESAINWFAVGSGYFQIGVLIDPLSAMTLFFVIWTVLMIFIYSVGYHNFGQPKGDHDRPGLPPHGATLSDAHGHKHTVMSIEPMYARFFAFISLFAFGMIVLVISNNLLTLFVGWEIMGLCSYLLIGFWYGKPSARAAMIKAFMTTRIGDMFLLLGIAYLYTQTGTLTYTEIFQPAVLEKLAVTPAVFGLFGWSAAALIGVLIFIGTIGKSAQFPLHVWLPDAMEGPTPVSAMIHAATMVSAGVFLVLRMFPVLAAGWEPAASHLTPPMMFMTVIGSFTALFAATIAVAQKDIKRVLAYSTISQLGFMIAALGIGAYVAAAFHLFTHAFFKALLFLGSGSVIHGVEHGVLHTNEHIDPQDMFNMGGLRKKMPLTFWTFVIGGLALAGFPILTAGFWSKDEILAEAFQSHQWVVLITLTLAALLTAFYTMRQITLTFLGKPRTSAAEHAHETPWTMTFPLVVLAVFAIGAGWFGIGKDFPLLGGLLPNVFHDFAGSTIGEAELVRFSIWPLLISLLVALGGLTLGWLVYRNYEVGQVDPVQKALGPIYKILQNKYYIDELYHTIFVRPAIWLSDVFANWVDRTVIDGFLHAIANVVGVIGSFLRNYIDKPVINGFGDWLASITQKLGFNLRPIQTGKIQQYMVYALTTAAIFAAVYFWIISSR